MLPLDEVELTYVESTDEVAEFLRWLGERRPVLGFDTETLGLDWWKWRADFIRLVQFADVNRGWTFRLDRWGQVIYDTFKNYTGRWAGHNSITFDALALRRCGLHTPSIRLHDDTLFIAKLTEGYAGNGLKTLAKKYLGEKATLGADLLDQAFAMHGLKPDTSEAWIKIPYECAAYSTYGALDPVLVARLWEILEPKLDATGQREHYERICSSAYVMNELMLQGLPVDVDYAVNLKSEWMHELSGLKTRIADFGIDNPSSKKQQIELLEEQGWEPSDFTETGRAKLDKKVMEDLDYEVIPLLLDYSRIRKWIAAYIDPIIYESIDGHAYPILNNFGARTGRQSAARPPVQQLPSRHKDAWKIRRMILPRDGDTLYSIDFAAQENRIMAIASGDKALHSVFLGGRDQYKIAAKAIWQLPNEDSVTAEQRGLAKVYTLASAFGAGDKKLAAGLGLHANAIPEIRQQIDAEFSGLAEWLKKEEKIVWDRWYSGKQAYIVNLFGQRVYLPVKNGKPDMKQILNTHTQGGGATMLRLKLCELAAAGLAEYILLTVHDEILFSVPPGQEGEEIIRECKRIMEIPSDFSIPFLASVEHYGESWRGHGG